jgi:hypothetical protein
LWQDCGKVNKIPVKGEFLHGVFAVAVTPHCLWDAAENPAVTMLCKEKSARRKQQERETNAARLAYRRAKYATSRRRLEYRPQSECSRGNIAARLWRAITFCNDALQ